MFLILCPNSVSTLLIKNAKVSLLSPRFCLDFGEPFTNKLHLYVTDLWLTLNVISLSALKIFATCLQSFPLLNCSTSKTSLNSKSS